VKQLYARDCRHRFCPSDHWLSARAAISHEAMKVSVFFDDENKASGGERDGSSKDVFRPGMSTLNARSVAMLEYVPFAIPFLQRVFVSRRLHIPIAIN